MTRMTTMLHALGASTNDIEELAEGVVEGFDGWPRRAGAQQGAVGSPSPPPCATRCSAPAFAEEDCEEPIVKLLLGLGDDRDREIALTVAGYFDRYTPALPFIRHHPPGLHQHVLFYWGGLASDPFERFDTRVEAESFANDPEMVRKYGRMEAIDCTGTRPLCLREGVRP